MPRGRYGNLGYKYCNGKAVRVSTARTRPHLLCAWIRILNNWRTITTDQRSFGLHKDDHAPVPRGDLPRRYGRTHCAPESNFATTGWARQNTCQGDVAKNLGISRRPSHMQGRTYCAPGQRPLGFRNDRAVKNKEVRTMSVTARPTWKGARFDEPYSTDVQSTQTRGAREAAHPPTSQGTCQRKRRRHCTAYSSARNRALATTRENHGGALNGEAFAREQGRARQPRLPAFSCGRDDCEARTDGGMP